MTNVAQKSKNATVSIVPQFSECSMICDLCKISFLRAGEKLTIGTGKATKKNFCSHDCRDRYRLKFSNNSCAYCDIKVEVKNCYTTPFEDGFLKFCTEIHAKCYLLQCKPDQVQDIERRGHRNLINSVDNTPDKSKVSNDNNTTGKKTKPVLSSMVDTCTICAKHVQILYCITYNKITHKICSRTCFDNFCKKEKIQDLQVCEECNEMIAPEQGDKISMIFEGKKHAFCKTQCMKLFQNSKRKTVSCGWCGKGKSNLDMIEYAVLNRNQKQISHFCCLTCLTKYRALGCKKLMDCSICFQNANPEYFIGYLNGQLENCCSLKCVHVRATEALASVRESVFVSRDGVYMTPQEVLKLKTLLLTSVTASKRKLSETNVGKNSLATVKNANTSAKKAKTFTDCVSPSLSSNAAYLQNIDTELIDLTQKANSIGNKSKGKSVLSKSTFDNNATQQKPKTTVVREFVPLPIPIPVPVYVPVPIMMFRQPAPEPVPIPIPMPCPIFFPTTLDKADDLIESINELKTRMPADPFEADIFAQAGAIEQEYSKKTDDNTETDDMNLSLGADSFLDDELFGRPNIPVYEIERDFNPLDWKVVSNQGGRKPGKGRGYGRGKTGPFALDSKYGLSVWNRHQHRTKSGLTQDIATLSSVQLCMALGKFVDEVRTNKGVPYRVDSLVYLLLSLQRHLNENKREEEQFFLKPYYYQFQQRLSVLVDSWQPNIYPHFQTVDTRVWEEHMWESGQLGAHTPYTLIFTVVYFMTKHLPITSAEELTQFSFKHIETIETKTSTKLKVGEFEKMIISNSEDPLRCPVKLVQFYLGKCPSAATEGSSSIFLTPQKKVDPSAGVWYGSVCVSKRELENMHSRVLMVKEVIQLWYDTGVYNSSNTETVME